VKQYSSTFAVLCACAFFGGASLAQAADPSADMQAVLDKLAALEAKPIHTLSVPEARTQASPADAAKAVQWEKRIPSAPEGKVATQDIAIPTSHASLPARVYIPEGEGPFPVVVYYHGGGWVLADLNVYDATPRGLALNAQAVVVSVDYRHAPEFRFPAAHEDAWEAYTWVIENVHTFNGDAARTAVAGESAGGNLAANVAIRARDQQTTQPVHQVLVYPVAGDDMTTASYQENADQVPLGKADMEWFVGHVFEDPAQAADPRLDLVAREDLADLPPATVILAELDPLRSEGETYAQHLKDAGVPTEVRVFPGVTHEFFGMAKVVEQAKAANDMAVSALKDAFAGKAN
jgi:acetyl esterase/lipase